MMSKDTAWNHSFVWRIYNLIIHDKFCILTISSIYMYNTYILALVYVKYTYTIIYIEALQSSVDATSFAASLGWDSRGRVFVADGCLRHSGVFSPMQVTKRVLRLGLWVFSTWLATHQYCWICPVSLTPLTNKYTWKPVSYNKNI